MEAELAPAPALAREPTVAREVIAGLIGTGVALGCIMPPLLHIVTGPLGPLIGGLIAARWVKPGARGRAIIAGTIGVGLSGVGAAGAAVVLSLASKPSWFPPAETLALILGGIGLYGAALGALGVTLAASFGRDDAEAK